MLKEPALVGSHAMPVPQSVMVWSVPAAASASPSAPEGCCSLCLRVCASGGTALLLCAQATTWISSSSPAAASTADISRVLRGLRERARLLGVCELAGSPWLWRLEVACSKAVMPEGSGRWSTWGKEKGGAEWLPDGQAAASSSCLQGTSCACCRRMMVMAKPLHRPHIKCRQSARVACTSIHRTAGFQCMRSQLVGRRTWQSCSWV